MPQKCRIRSEKKPGGLAGCMQKGNTNGAACAFDEGGNLLGVQGYFFFEMCLRVAAHKMTVVHGPYHSPWGDCEDTLVMHFTCGRT